MPIDVPSVLRLSRDLQQATTPEHVAEAVREAVLRSTGYPTAWLGVMENGPERMIEILFASGPGEAGIARLPRFPSRGDAMLDEIDATRAPVVVVDARTDPRTNKDIVARTGNRTIINIPLLFGDDLLGALGVGTFAPEAPRAPRPEDVENLVVFATQAAAALQRIQLLQSRTAMQRQLHVAQRLEGLALLTGGVAHDFKNLLTVILSGIQVARREATPAQAAALDDVLEAARRANELTRQLLALARRQPMELVPVDLSPRLQSLLAMARRLLPEAVLLEAEVPASLPPVLADPPQIDQVLLNLIVNARDAMPAGGRLRVRAEEVESAELPGGAPGRSRRCLRLSVADDGVGMAPEVMERVLEPFFTTKPVGQGTGLGLPVAAGIVGQHGGGLSVESSPGVGSTFTVLLPVFDGPLPAVRRAAAPTTGHATGRVLLAEDDRAVRSIAEQTLAGAGYRVVAVADGVEAIEAARDQGKFDLVVLNAVLPRAGGRQVWEAIGAAQPGTRFLVASGHAAMAFRPEELRELGIPFLEKPYTPDELLAAVRAALHEPAAVAERAGS